MQYSALKAKAPHGEDVVLRIAFKEAYDCTRRHLGRWGYYRLDRPQEQQLAALVVERCVASAGFACWVWEPACACGSCVTWHRWSETSVAVVMWLEQLRGAGCEQDLRVDSRWKGRGEGEAAGTLLAASFACPG